MKGIIAIALFLLAGLASAYTPEQQTLIDGMNLSAQICMAYEMASHGQNVTEYNALVDEYNAFIRQHFGEDASLLKSKISPGATTTSIAGTPGGNSYLVRTPFNSSSGLSTFGKEQVYAQLPVGTTQEGVAYDISEAKAAQFIRS